MAAELRSRARLEVDLETIRTDGDRHADRALPEIGGKGLFTAALDQALLEGHIDLAVHSLKDLPTTPTPGLRIAAIPRREDPRDVLVLPPGAPATLGSLPTQARVGTSSLRRQALALAFRKDLRVLPIRGNVDTRLEKLDRGHYDALLLAAAGLIRMGLADRISERLERTAWIPAVGQGALAVMIRDDDEATGRAVETLTDTSTRQAVNAERELLHLLEGGCHVPVGALALPYQGGLRLWAIVVSPDGRRAVRVDRTGDLVEPERLAARVVESLLDRGAGEILTELNTELPGAPSAS